MSGVTTTVRQIVLMRDGYACVRCARYIAFSDYSLHHRRPRGAGGSSRPETNLPANLVTLCGHATSPDGCHAWVESNRDEARALGLLLFQAQTPSAEPVRTYRGLLLLDDEGCWAEVAA